MKKCVVSYSGGMDSTVLLWSLFKNGEYDEIHCISYNYGQRHKVEIECAKWNINHLNSLNEKTKVIWKQIDIPFMRDIAPVSYLTSDNIQKPTDPTDTKPTSYVPNRNMIMISIAASYAESIKANYIIYGAMKDDFGGYWDCRLEYYELLNKIFDNNPNCKIQILTPFMNYTKEDIIKIGIDYDVKFEHTWSDYSGGKQYHLTESCLYKADAESANSQLRLNAFAKLGYIDPLPYQQDLTEFWKKHNCVKL